ncbi:MAG: hypothetical protein AABZ47_12415 [Planctomycetota bacterium]
MIAFWKKNPATVGRRRWGFKFSLKGFCSTVLFCFFLQGCATQTTTAGAATSQRSSKGTGAPWTIQCLELRGPNARREIEETAATLRRTPGIRPTDVFPFHDEVGSSQLCYGTYYRKADPKTGKRPISQAMQADLELLRQLGSDTGQRYFALAMFVRKPVSDVGNSEWCLTNAPGKYSLQVAAFEPTDEFGEYKQAAADYCEWLRKQNHQAYYHHGPSSSIVTVGSFDESAVIPSDRGLPRYRADVIALQQNELFRYNLVNGAVLRASPVEIVGLPKPPKSVAKDKKKAPQAEHQRVPSRLVPIPRSLPATSR